MHRHHEPGCIPCLAQKTVAARPCHRGQTQVTHDHGPREKNRRLSALKGDCTEETLRKAAIDIPGHVILHVITRQHMLF